MIRRRDGREDLTGPAEGNDRGRSDAGDTLVEILVTLGVLGFAAMALLLAFATTISGSGEHRNIVTMDTMLRTASAEVFSAIQQQPNSTFTSCSGANQVNLSGIPLPNPSAPGTNPYSATISNAQYWSSTTNTFTTPPISPPTSCPSGVTGGGPQLLTVSVSFHSASGITSSTITTVVDNPNAPTQASTCPGTKATQLVWVTQPGDGTAGTALFPSPTVALQDATGCTEQNDATQVTLSVSSGPGSLSNCVPNLGLGETTFRDCTIGAPGTYQLTATDAADHLTSQASNSFMITQGVPVQLVFTTSPSNSYGGQAFTPNQPVVKIEDSSGNVVTTDNTAITLAIGTNPGGGTLSGCTATTVNGEADFSGCQIDKAGNGYTLTATDATDGLTTPSAPSNPFNITPGPAAQLVFTTSPGTSVAGDPLTPQPVVAIEDAGGNVTTMNTGTVSLGIGTNPGGGAITGCTQSVSGGIVTFANCSVSPAGNGYTLKATDSLFTATAISDAFNVVAPQLTSFQVLPSTTTPNAGAPFQVTINALDQSGYLYTGLTGTQSIAFSGPSPAPNGTAPVYPPTVTFTGGVGKPNVTLFDAQTTQLTATMIPVPGTTISGTSANITVKPLTAKTLAVSGFPNPTVAGASGSVTVTADDTYGNVATGYTGTVTFTSSDTKAVLPGNYHFTAGNAGTRTFTNGVTLNTAGTQSITATDTVTNTITGTQGGITVTKASPSIATTLSPPSIAVGGQAHDTATLTGSVNSTGSATVIYSYYTNNTCSAGQSAVNTVTVNTSGTVPNSSNVTFNTAGTYYWQAVYSGDANNNGASSPCTAGSNEQLTVAKASPTIATALSASNITVGTTAYRHRDPHRRGQLHRQRHGHLQLLHEQHLLGEPRHPQHGHRGHEQRGAQLVRGDLQHRRPYYWQAVYSGDANNNGASSPCTAGNNEQLTVKYSPTIGTTLSAANLTVGTQAHDTATLTGSVNSTGTATVAYSYYTNNTCSAGQSRGQHGHGEHEWRGAQLEQRDLQHRGPLLLAGGLQRGRQQLRRREPVHGGQQRATHGGQGLADHRHDAVSAGITAGGQAHDTATLTGSVNSTGSATVVYSYYTNNTCSAGQVTVNTVTVNTSGVVPNSAAATFNTAGTYYWQAVYSGDANNNGASSPCTAGSNEQLTVAKASPTIATTLSPRASPSAARPTTPPR